MTSAQSINPDLNPEVPKIENRYQAADEILANPDIQDLVYYSTQTHMHLLRQDLERESGTGVDMNTGRESEILEKLVKEVETVSDMKPLTDGGGLDNTNGDLIGYVRYGEKPTLENPNAEQLTVEVKYLNHAQRKSLGISAEDATIRTEVACHLDISTRTAKAVGTEGKHQYEKTIIKIADQMGVRIELDRQGNVVGLKGLNYRKNTAYGIELPFNDQINLAGLVPHMNYITTPPERKEESGKKKKKRN